MPEATDLLELSSALNNGLVADRALLAIALHAPEAFTDSERTALLESGELLQTMFLEEPSELASRGKVAYLTSAQSGYSHLARQPNKEDLTAFRSLVTSAVETALALGAGRAFDQTKVPVLEGLLDTLSRVTRDQMTIMRNRTKPRGDRWRRQTVVE